MSLVWLYIIMGEFFVLLAISDEEGIAQVRWLAQKAPWWAPYVGAVIFVVAWPAAAPLSLLLHKSE
jgi:hypothetical protein